MAQTPQTSAEAPKNRGRGRPRWLFLAAVGLFLLWVAALVGLAIVSGYRPMDRAGTVPPAFAPELDHAEEPAAK